MPEKVLKKLNAYILPAWKACFWTGLITGILAHLYKITNWLPNWDSLVFRYDAQNMISLGRWFLPVVSAFSSFYDLPFLNGIITIIFHAFGAVCICRILHVQKKITAGLIGAVIVSFPTVTSVMMYNYVADAYSIAFFLSTLAALYMTKEKPKIILPVILITLAVGIYQAYITVTIMLVLIKLIDEIIYYKASFQNVLKKSVYMLLTGILGVALYGILLKALLSVFSAELMDYQGISETATLGGIDLARSLYVIKETFMKCFFDLSEGINVYFILNVFVFVFTIAHYVKYIIKNNLYKKPVNILFVLILSVMLIAGAGALAFVNADVDYHNLMLMGYAVFYLFFMVLYERGTEKNEIHASIKCWTLLITALMLIFNQIVIANVSYHKAQIAYEKSYGVLVRIADRIEKIKVNEASEKLLVLGALRNSEDYSVNLPPDITGITDGYILRRDDETVGQSVLSSALNDYCDMNFKFISGEEKKKLAETETVKSMGVWPAEDSVKIVDDIVVIKLSTEGEK